MHESLHESFLTYRQFRYLKLGLLLLALSFTAYLLHDPVEPPNGGTWLGYTLGGLGAGLILWLTWFGVRKRQYRSRLGTVNGWLSAHVYLGTVLWLIATLHTGLQFGWNVHTLAYGLMTLTILSGFYGAFAYLRYPPQITELSAEQYIDDMLNDIAERDRECLELADQIGDRAQQIVSRSLERTAIGGGLWRQLTASRPRRSAPLAGAEDDLAALRKQLEAEQTQLLQTLAQPVPADAKTSDETTFLVAGQLAAAQGQEKTQQVRQLLDLIGQKKNLVKRLQQVVQYHALMRFWLLLHVPLAVALLAALLVHVITVFLYW